MVDDETLITVAGMIALVVFGSMILQGGCDGYTTKLVIALIAASMGLLTPRPGFIRNRK